MTYIIGLTGGVGSGKSTVATLFSHYGIDIIDSDAIAHQLTQKDGAALPAISSAFGKSCLRADGALDRAAMRRLVFNNAEARRQLESILHPMIRDISAQACRNAKSVYAILMVPLLIESGNWVERCRRLLVVDCREETQLSRIMARNKLSESEAQAIMAAQTSRAARRAAADDIIDNDGDVDALRPQVSRLHALYLQLAAADRTGSLNTLS